MFNQKEEEFGFFTIKSQSKHLSIRSRASGTRWSRKDTVLCFPLWKQSEVVRKKKSVGKEGQSRQCEHQLQLREIREVVEPFSVQND